MSELTITMIDGKPAVFLPEDFASRHDLHEVDKLQAIESAAGTLLRKVNPQTAEQIEIALGVMDRRRDALRQLGES